ncbi:MAG: ABC transporter permease [Sporolactobacillus sp.]
MAILLNNWKRFIRRKTSLMIYLIVPLIFIVFSFSGLGSQKATVGIIDQDHSRLTGQIIQTIKSQATIVPMKRSEVQSKLVNGYADTVFQFDKGFEKELLAGAHPRLRSYHVQESNLSEGIRQFAESDIQNSYLIAAAAHGNSKQFFKSLRVYDQNRLQLKTGGIIKDDRIRARTFSALGFVIYGLFMIASITSSMIIEDKEKRVYNRLMTTPLSLRSYNWQNIISYLALGAITIAALLLLLKMIFHTDLGPSTPIVYLVLLSFSFVAVSLGVALSAFTNTRRQASNFTTLLTVPIAMLGGCFWPVSIMPQWMQQLAKFTPTFWGIDALKKLVYGNGASAVILNVILLIAFAMVFLLMASWKKGKQAGT